MLNLNKSPVLPISTCGRSIDGTTPIDGNRNRYLCGFFIPQIFLSLSFQVLFDNSRKAEFVEWLICGNKASNRTNNASRSIAVVETISHPFTQGGNLLLTKLLRKPTMKTNPKHTALLASLSPIAFNSDVMEVVYA